MLVFDVVASLAVTLDGYVARTDGSVDYLDKYPMEDFNFSEFTNTIGALIMGRETYETALGFGWIWEDMPTMVLTHQRSRRARRSKREVQGTAHSRDHTLILR